MQGTHIFRADAKTEIDLESFVAKDHPLRKVDRVLDLAFVRELTAPCYSQLGAPSIDPEVFFRMLLVAYHYGITSDRRRSRIRDRYSEAIFEAVFRQAFISQKLFSWGPITHEPP